MDVDTSLGLFTSIDKCVEWISKYGRGWEDTDFGGNSIDYYFVVLSFIVDLETEHQPFREIYYYDKDGNLEDKYLDEWEDNT